MNDESRINFIRTSLVNHDDYWDRQRHVMTKLREAYMTQFYQGHDQVFADSMVRVEVAEGYSYVESTIGSLFTQAPGVEVGRDPVNTTGNPDVVETLANRFLQRKRQALEEVSRLAIIYPCGFLKLAPRESNDPLERVDIRAVEPWNVIVDSEADSWETQRFCAHVYWLPVSDAKHRFGNRDFKPEPKLDYFDKTPNRRDGARQIQLPDEFLYVKIVETYDLVHDELTFWSPQYADGTKLLDRSQIPVRDWDDTPLPGLVPLYFSRVPGKPLEGYSSLARIYDQITEKNYARTRMANNVRRDARMFLYNKEALDEHALGLIATGQDGAMIPVEGDMDKALKPIPTPPINHNHGRYLDEIQSDLDRGSFLAPFTRGEATKSTATEVSLLQQYTASEIGRLARNRDETIERLANVYVRMLFVALDEEAKIVVDSDDAPVVVTPEMLDGKFVIYALDGASTPVGDWLRQNALVSIGPLLIQLGANPQYVREEIVKAYRLPKRLAEDAPAPEVETQKVGPLSEAALELISQDELGQDSFYAGNQ